MSPIALVLCYAVLTRASILSVREKPIQPNSMYDFQDGASVYQTTGGLVAEILRTRALGHQDKEDKLIDIGTNTIPIKEEKEEQQETTIQGSSTTPVQSIFHRVVASITGRGYIGVTSQFSKRSVDGWTNQMETTPESFQHHAIGAITVAPPSSLRPSSKNSTEVKKSSKKLKFALHSVSAIFWLTAALFACVFTALWYGIKSAVVCISKKFCVGSSETETKEEIKLSYFNLIV